MKLVAEYLVDAIKRATRGHGAPMCTKCNEPMAWVHSGLAEPHAIVSIFHCPKCGDRKEVRSKIQKPE